jgi:hypothetical protein
MARDAVQKTKDYRRRLRERGLRPVQILVPDLRDPAVVERLRTQVRALRGGPVGAEVERLLEANLAEIDGWTG